MSVDTHVISMDRCVKVSYTLNSIVSIIVHIWDMYDIDARSGGGQFTRVR